MAGVRIFEIGCVLAWVCAALGLPACVTDSNTNWLTELKPDDGVYRASALTQKRPFAEYAATELSYTPSIETYGLPLRLSDVENLDRDIRGQSDLFDWTADEEALLAQNGLVAVAGQPEMTRFEHAYAELKDRDLPILVTADSALHLVHLAFQQVLKNLEVQELAPRLGALLPELARSLGALYKALDGDLKEAARRDLAWVSVAASLLDPLGFQAVPEVADEVEKALQYIRTAGEELEGGRAASPVFSRDCSSPDACAEKDSPLEDDPEGAACRCEDYTQYQPRGHYTETEELSRYFRCFTYLSRMSMRIESPMETTMAALLTAALNKTTVDFRGAEAPAVSMWDGIYRATSFFVGAAEDLTFIEYDRLLGQVYGEAFSIRELADEAKLGQLRTMLREAREAQVATGFGEAALQADETSAGLRFFGRHFPFDAYSLAQMAFQHLGPNPQDPNYNYVIENLDPDCVSEAGQEQGAGDLAQCEGQDSADWQSICCSAARLAAIEERPELTEICRFLPSGLDLAAAFGSDRAEQHLQADVQGYCEFEEQLASLRQEVSEFTDEDWWRTLYSGWSFALRPLFDKDLTGFPVWMTTDAYQDKSLNTALASWAGLRHDSALYVKQSYTSQLPQAVAPSDLYWVEPMPEVYGALSDLSKLIRTGLSDMDLFGDDFAEPFNRLVELLDELVAVAMDELAGNSLSGGQKFTIEFMGERMLEIINELALVTGEKAERPGELFVQRFEADDAPYDGVLITDVHSDGNTEKLLHVGSGGIDWVIAVRRLDDGTLGAVIGPIFSYREFPWPITDRLEDPSWQQLLDSSQRPARPSFVQDLYGQD